MKYIAYGKREDVIDNNISDEILQLFIDSINALGVEHSRRRTLGKTSRD